MRKLAVLAVVGLLACQKEASPDIPPVRDPIAIEYVGAPELIVRSKPEDTAPQVTKFLNGETVSILARQGEWVEVRTTDGSGWARANELTTAVGAKEEEENPTPRFRVPPSPVTQPGAKGTVYIEASVNTEGDVTSTKIITNSTGIEALGSRNAAAIAAAKFHPIVQKGQRQPFLYYYRVDY